MTKSICWVRQVMSLVLLLLIIGLSAACAGPGPAAPAAEKAPAAEVAAPVEEKEVSEAEAGPRQGGVLVFALYQEPEILNAYIRTQTAASEVGIFIEEALLYVDQNGEYQPDLAKEVPTVENGGVSEDGLTITFHLLENVVWSDGDPLTCEDWQFTLEAVMHPESGAVSTSGWRDLEAIECPDEYTVVFKFKKFYAPYLSLATAPPLPSHLGLDPANMTKWDYNWNLIGTGPFKMTEWVSGDHITLVRNEKYRKWKTEGKPYLDSVIIQITPSREVGKELIKTGEIDVLWDLIEADIPEFTDLPGVVLSAPPDTGTERLVFNLRDPKVDAPCGDALREDPMPHWALGDLRVRQAIQYGIDKHLINDKLLFGKATIGTTEHNLGWAKGNIPESEYNPEKARQLLEEAGWIDKDGDGIRECHGCPYADEGRKLRLKIQTTTGNKLREQVEQVLIEMMQDIGIEFYIENVPSSELFASYASGAFRKHGHYDILMYTTSYGIDPQSHTEGYFASWNIPCDDNAGRGFNYSRWIDDEFDKWIEIAGSSPDIEVRREAYQKAMERIAAGIPHLYLYDRLELNAYRDVLQGWIDNNWDNLGWNADEWWLKQ